MRCLRRPIRRPLAPTSQPTSAIWRAAIFLVGPAAVPPVRLRSAAFAFNFSRWRPRLSSSGRDPQTIRSLADLVQPEALKTALTFFWTRNGNRKTGQLHNFALTAIKIAKYWVKSPSEQIAALQAIRRQVDPQYTGMTERNRARLRQFDDPENLRRLINLPETIWRSVRRTGPVGYAAAIRVQTALAIGILLVAPMRMKNLASLNLGRHLSRTRPGGLRHIVIPPQEVKNDTPLSFEIPGHLGELLDFYLARCRPILSEDSSGYLFPAPRNGGAKTPLHLGAQIKHTIAREAGIDSQPPRVPPPLGQAVFGRASGRIRDRTSFPRPPEPQHDGQDLLRPRTGRCIAPPRRPHRSSSQQPGGSR